MAWNDRSGGDIIAACPKDYSVDSKLLLQIFSQHEYTGEAGFVQMMTENLNVASFYTGAAHQLYIVLFLTSQEDGSLFEDGLADLAHYIVRNLESDQLQAVLEEQFRRLSIYLRINNEQKLAFCYLNDVRRAIIHRLREEGLIIKAELDLWIKDEFKQQEIDVGATINGILKNGLAKVVSVEGYTSELVFLIGDLMITRKPPMFYRNPTEYHCPDSLNKEYRTQIRAYFSDYHPSETDNFQIIERIILDPVNYTVLELLRLAIVTRDNLEKLKRKGVEDIDTALNTFLEMRLITVLHDSKGNDYYALLTDVEITPFFPRYMLNLIRQYYTVKRHNNQALMVHLDLLRQEYIRLYGKRKKKSKGEELPQSFTASDTPMNLKFDTQDVLTETQKS